MANNCLIQTAIDEFSKFTFSKIISKIVTKSDPFSKDFLNFLGFFINNAHFLFGFLRTNKILKSISWDSEFSKIDLGGWDKVDTFLNYPYHQLDVRFHYFILLARNLDELYHLEVYNNEFGCNTLRIYASEIDLKMIISKLALVNFRKNM